MRSTKGYRSTLLCAIALGSLSRVRKSNTVRGITGGYCLNPSIANSKVVTHPFKSEVTPTYVYLYFCPQIVHSDCGVAGPSPSGSILILRCCSISLIVLGLTGLVKKTSNSHVSASARASALAKPVNAMIVLRK